MASKEQDPDTAHMQTNDADRVRDIAVAKPFLPIAAMVEIR